MSRKVVSRPAATDDLSLLRHLTEREAADFLGYSVRALQNWRVRGGGPRFVRVSARSVRYRLTDLIAWAEARLCDNTSQAPGRSSAPAPASIGSTTLRRRT